MATWLRDRRGDLVWNALVVMTVLLPLASLAVDIPRYYTLRTRLQLATDAAAEAAARAVDVGHFQNTGEVRLAPGAPAEAYAAFQIATANLTTQGYTPVLAALRVDEAADAVTAEGRGTTRLFFGLTPAFAVHVAATSRFRMDKR